MVQFYLLGLITGMDQMAVLGSSVPVCLVSLFLQMKYKDDDVALVRFLAYAPALVAMAVSYQTVLSDCRLQCYAGFFTSSMLFDLSDFPDKLSLSLAFSSFQKAKTRVNHRWIASLPVCEALVVKTRALAAYALGTAYLLKHHDVDGMTAYEAAVFAFFASLWQQFMARIGKS